MRFSKVLYLVILCSYVTIPTARATVVEDVGLSKPGCQIELGALARPPVQRLSLPFLDEEKHFVALKAVVPDFDPARDVVVGIRSRKHTYLVNALIGRHDPGIFGGRGRFHDNTRVDRLRLSPGLILRLRLTAPMVERMAAEMQRLRNARNLTCTNTTARILAHAGVPGMHASIFTPLQMLRAFGTCRDVDARLYLVNSDADGLEDFEDRVKVIGAKKPVPPTDPNQPRRDGSASCDGEDSSEGCMIACLDLNWCLDSSQSGGGSCAESGSSECGACDSGGSESDSDCCN